MYLVPLSFLYLSVLLENSLSVGGSDVLELGDADFEVRVAAHDTLLVEFFAPWYEALHYAVSQLPASVRHQTL